MVFAPQGAGKGVGIVVPNLLTYRGSVICTDPKGENRAITGRQREQFGAVYCLDVADPDRSHRFNPMDAIRRDDLVAVDDCRRLAELLMPKEAGDEDDHWRRRSVSILTGFLLYVDRAPRRRGRPVQPGHRGRACCRRRWPSSKTRWMR